MTSPFLNFVSFALLLAAMLSAILVLRGRTKWDRLLGYGIVATKVNMIIIIFALLSGNSFYLDIALVYMLLSYIAIVALADYFYEHGGPDHV